MPLRVVGAGLGRTGTNSLKLALERLLDGRCYHMFELHRRPQDLPAWEDAVPGRPVDWRARFTDFHATVDWPLDPGADPGVDAPVGPRYRSGTMTAKEQLRKRIETLSEEEAGEALRLPDLRVDPVIAAFRDAPPTMSRGPRRMRPRPQRAGPTWLPVACCRWRRRCGNPSERRRLARSAHPHRRS